jgi:hypothetical protein
VPGRLRGNLADDGGRLLARFDDPWAILSVGDGGPADEDADDEEPEGAGDAGPERVPVTALGGATDGRGDGHVSSRRALVRVLREGGARPRREFGVDEGELGAEGLVSHAPVILVEGRVPSRRRSLEE